MPVTFKQLIETGILPDSAKKARDPKYDVKDRIKKLAGLDDSDITSFDIEDVESKSFDNVVKGRSNTEINRGEARGNPEMPKAVQEDFKKVLRHGADAIGAAGRGAAIGGGLATIAAVAHGADPDTVQKVGMAGLKTGAAVGAGVHAVATAADHIANRIRNRKKPAQNAVHEAYEAGSIKLKDGTLFELDEIGAHCLNKMLSKVKRPESFDKVVRKNSKEFTSILQFAKSLGESAELQEGYFEGRKDYQEIARDKSFLAKHKWSSIAAEIKKNDPDGYEQAAKGARSVPGGIIGHAAPWLIVFFYERIKTNKKNVKESTELSEVNSRAFQRITGVSLKPTTSSYHKFEDDRGGSSSNYKDPAQVKKDKDKLSNVEFNTDAQKYKKASRKERISLEKKWGERSSYFKGDE